MRRMTRLLRWTILGVVLLVFSGWLLADHLMPQATGAPAHALPVQEAQTALDRELAPLVARHPGQTGVLVVSDGIDAFAARAIAARQAGRSLDLQYYIWDGDLTGRLLAREAWNAAERGVRVRMLLDDINAQGKDNALLALDAHPNIELRLFNPVRNRTGPLRLLEMLQRSLSLNHRMHNKAWIADGRVAVVGGRNIGDQYFDNHAQQNFRDMDALLFGPVVAQASAIFDEFWNSAAAIPIASLHRADDDARDALLDLAQADQASTQAQAYLRRVTTAPSVARYLAQTLSPHWTADVALHSDPPLKWERGDRADWIVHRITAQLRQTRRQALIVSPYFVPGESMTRQLAQKRRQGAYIGIVTNSLASNDVTAVHSGYSRYRPRLLQAGIDLYELRVKAHRPSAMFGRSNASLHTKAYVVDSEQGFIGSFNLDPRSANLNTEMGLLFCHRGIAADVQREYLRLIDPQLSDWVFVDARGDVRWLDRSVAPARIVAVEPNTTLPLRLKARLLGVLPMESQL